MFLAAFGVRIPFSGGILCKIPISTYLKGVFPRKFAYKPFPRFSGTIASLNGSAYFRAMSSSTYRLRNWHELAIIVDRKLRFQARHVPLLDPKDIPLILQDFLQEHKNIAKTASHPHMLAWSIGPGSGPKIAEKAPKGAKKTPSGSKKRALPNAEVAEQPSLASRPSIQQGSNDNGEKGAGMRMLEVLTRHNVTNTLLICTRWYGGSPIGSLRFRHIASASLDSLRRAKSPYSNIT